MNTPRRKASKVAKSDVTRERIVRTAATAFREHGVEGIGVRDIMKRAGLTQGGFYFHFRDKEHLFREAAREGTEATSAWLFGPSEKAPVGKQLEVFIDTYLSAEHRDHRETGCMVSALGADVARGGKSLRGDFSDVISFMIDRVAKYMAGPDEGDRRQKAGLMLSSMAGVLMVSRVITDKTRSDALLANARRFYTNAFSRA